MEAGLTSSSMGRLHVVRPTMPDRMTWKEEGKNVSFTHNHLQSPAVKDGSNGREAKEEEG